ncbi:TonB-dependent receptor [Sphingomonas sp. PAMC 26617]|uniref:TonB-dependent receptor n=1 Tax=Sphingomonas sp. PAMC 26617 TaxID=1112216 RepID=UPI000318FEC3|nr:TonB-dependent receptor [Sphingomonas sp. PAMC 26617]
MTVRSGLRLQLLLGGAMLALTAAPAMAQTTTAADAAQTPAGDVAPTAAAATDQQGIGDIVVTATRRETNLQKTPISISVLSSQGIADRHVQSLFNLADGSIPSLRVATFEARQSALTIGIRGIVPYDQNQTARDGGVGVYIDGIALGKTQGLNAALFDIERIEVLKGPQGTLFGRNTEGGALSLVSKAPTGILGGRVTAGVGNYGSHNADLHLDLPSFYNISLKFDGVYQHQDPTVKDPLTGSTGWNYYDRKGGRAAARWQPIDGFTADFAYDYAKDENTPQYSQLLNYNPNNYAVGTYNAAGGLTLNGAACGGTITPAQTAAGRQICIAPKGPLVGVHPDRQTVADVGVPQQPSVDITHGFSANLKYKLAPWLELRSITAWRGVSTDQWDNSGGPERSTFAPFVPNTANPAAINTTGTFSRYSLSFLRQHQFSQEVQAVGSIPQFDYVVGGYYYTEQASEYAATPLSNQWNGDGTAYTVRSPIPGNSTAISAANSGYQQYDPSCNNGLANTAPQFRNSCQFITRASAATDHNYSVFGNLTFTPEALGNVVHITAGGRWTKDDRHGLLYVVNNRTDLNPVTTVANSTATPFTFKSNISRFDPMINIAFDATPDVHLYAKYATGFRAGGANDRSLQFNAFGPESVKSYEVGAKMDFLQHRARLNLAGYIMDRKNTQFDFDYFDTNGSSVTNGSHIEQTVNAGNSKIRGIEADLTVKPFPELTLTGSYAYTYWKAPSAISPLGGGLQQLYIVYTPNNAASGAIDYVTPIHIGDASVRLHLDGNYASSQYSFQLEPTKTDASFVMNGRLALADISVNDHNKVTVAVWARNLLDTTYVYRRSSANSGPVQNIGANGQLISTNYGGILGDYGNFNPPRTWGLELSAKF